MIFHIFFYLCQQYEELTTSQPVFAAIIMMAVTPAFAQEELSGINP